MSHWQLTWMLTIGLVTLSTGCGGSGPEQDVLRIGMLPKLEGTVHVNMALIIKLCNVLIAIHLNLALWLAKVCGKIMLN